MAEEPLPAKSAKEEHLPGNSDKVPQNDNKKHSKKRKKRERGQKSKKRTLIPIGEGPNVKKSKNGRYVELDILRPDYDDQKMSRKTREFVERMNAFKASSKKKGTSSSQKPCASISEDVVSKPIEQHDGQVGNTSDRPLEKEDRNESQQKKKDQNTPKVDGIQPGESFAQFSARLRQETKKAILQTTRKESNQRVKKRAYYERRQERIERKKRRRRGEYSDDDTAKEDDQYESISHMPLYWQEIVRNNGRPVTEKTRRRQKRREEREMDKVSFGDRVERPPQFSSLPARRNRWRNIGI